MRLEAISFWKPSGRSRRIRSSRSATASFSGVRITREKDHSRNRRRKKRGFWQLSPWLLGDWLNLTRHPPKRSVCSPRLPANSACTDVRGKTTQSPGRWVPHREEHSADEGTPKDCDSSSLASIVSTKPASGWLMSPRSECLLGHEPESTILAWILEYS